MTKPHSQKLWAILRTDATGQREFLSVASGLLTAPTRKQCQYMLAKWREISQSPDKAKVVRINVRSV